MIENSEKKPNSFIFARGTYNALRNPSGPPKLILGPLSPPLVSCLPHAIGIYCPLLLLLPLTGHFLPIPKL